MRQVFHAACVLALALAPQGGRGVPAPAGPLWALAAQSDGALVASHARDLPLHLRDVLDLVGMSFPELSARQVGTLRGTGGVLRVVDLAGFEEAAIPPDAPLGIFRFPHAPAPVVAVGGVDAEVCTAIRARIHAGPTEHAAAWARAGLCLMVVGECADQRCSPVGIRPPRALPPRLASAVESLPDVGVRALVPGSSLVRMVPREARSATAQVEWLALQWHRSDVGLTGGLALVLTRALTDGGLVPLHGAVLPTSPRPLLELTLRPSEGAVKSLTRWLKQQAGARVDGLVGPDGADVLGQLRPRTLGVAWLGLEPQHAVAKRPQDTFMAFHGVLTTESGNTERAARADLSLDTRLRGQGFTRDPDGVHRRPPASQLRVERDGTRLAVTTGTSAAATEQTPWPVVEAPARATVRVRLNGKRLHGAMAGIPLLHGAATPELRAALGVREVLGPSLYRLGDVVAWLWTEKKHTLRVQFSAGL